MTTPQTYVQQKAAASGSSFYYAFLFLPEAQRQAITAFYAFCREVDDVVDEVHDPEVAARTLQWWSREVSAAFAGKGPLARHRAVYAALGDMMETDIHALSIKARTPDEAA